MTLKPYQFSFDPTSQDQGLLSDSRPHYYDNLWSYRRIADQQNFSDDPTMKTVPYARLGFRYEPHVADMIFKQMAAEVPSIEVFYRRVAVKVLKSGNRVTGVVTRM